MFYKIMLDEKHQDAVNIMIKLPGLEGDVLHLSFHVNGGKYTATPFPTLPSAPSAMHLTDCQNSLANLIRHLVANGLATYAGKYKKGARTIPLFRSDSTGSLYVDSVDKKTGQNLLKGKLMKNPDKVKKLANWIVSKFPTVSGWANVTYNTALKEEDELAYILIMAERFILERQEATLLAHE